MAKSKKQVEESESAKGEAAKGEVIEKTLETDADGNAFLPSMERKVKVIPELAAEIKRNKLKLVPAFLDLKEKLSQSNKKVREIAEKFKGDLEYDAEREVYVYDDGEVHCEIAERPEISFSIIQ